MVKARRVSDRVMNVIVVFEEDGVRLICQYALQSGQSLEGLKGEWDMHCEGDVVLCLGDVNGHIELVGILVD